MKIKNFLYLTSCEFLLNHFMLHNKGLEREFILHKFWSKNLFSHFVLRALKYKCPQVDNLVTKL